MPVSRRRIGSANANRTRGLPVRFRPVGSAWMYFQYGWYARRLRNTTTNRRRHSAVTAQPWADGRGRGCGATELNCSLFDPRPVCEVRFTNRGEADALVCAGPPWSGSSKALQREADGGVGAGQGARPTMRLLRQDTSAGRSAQARPAVPESPPRPCVDRSRRN